MKDYYATLGVSRSATPEEIKKAYRKLALDCHPDRHPNNDVAAQHFLQVDEAYRTLIDQNKRRHYDNFGGTGMPSRSQNSGFNWDDFFDSFRSRSDNNTRETRTRTPETPQEPYAYNGLLWEPRVFRKQSGDKELLYFDQSLDRLRRAGFERHPRPAEAMGFLAAGLEGKLNEAEKAIYDDMLTSWGEWLSAAMQVVQKGSSQILEVYLDPEGLVFDGSKYVQQNFKSSDKREYDITCIPLEQYVDLNRFPDTFVVDMYSRSFASLPQELREGDRRAEVYLSSPNQIWPVGRYYFYYGFIISYFNYNRASRGVVVGQKKFHRK